MPLKLITILLIFVLSIIMISIILSKTNNDIDCVELSNNKDILSIKNADKFGIKKLYQTIPNSREWYSKWDNCRVRKWDSSSNDPYDQEFITAHKGKASYSTDGLGILKISGSSPRMYIMDEKRMKNWHNVEITVYAKRVADSDITYGGIMTYARTNHYIDENICDDRGYGGRFTYDGRVDFEKEIVHHEDGYVQAAIIKYWKNGIPRGEWIGYKFIVYDIISNNTQNGNVKLELWIDTTDGLNGGSWEIVDEFIDNGNNFGIGNITCKKGINPSLKLTNSDIRPGSETGKPNLAVYFRSDGVGTDGLWYKKASIREIGTN